MMKKETDCVILAIETSCDETSVAVIKNGSEILSHVVHSQIASHKRFGGVVPEIASRHHVEMMTLVLEEALAQSNCTWEQIDAVAVTQGPGLVGALLIGIHAAKALAFAHNKPLIPVHHIVGHIYANALVEPFQYPCMALVVSGGHTELIYIQEEGSFKVIGETRDDAVGEAYDKVARKLDIPYPGGPYVDKMAAIGAETYPLPRAWLEEGSFDFSFSGLKSAVVNMVHNVEQRGEALHKEDLAASFQASVMDVLLKKTEQALEKYHVNRLIVAGGVAANQGLRARLEQLKQKKDIQVCIPPMNLCTDNAAMIGAAAYVVYKKQKYAQMDLNAEPGLDLEQYLCEKQNIL